MTNFNLLPWREEARLVNQAKFYKFSLAYLLLGILVVILGYLTLSKALSLQASKNKFLKTQIAIVDNDIFQINTLKKTKLALIERIDLIEQLQDSRNLPTQILDSLAKIMVDGVYFEKVQRRENTLWIDGVTDSNNHLADLLRNFEHSPLFKDPLVKKIHLQPANTKQRHNFSLRIDVN